MYYIVFIIGIILSIINDKKRISFKLLALILSILAFLRYGVGADYFAYKYLYSRLNDSLIFELKYGIDNQEVLFRLIGSLIKKIGFSYQGYIIIIAIINMYYITKICNKYSKNPTFSLFIYFCFYYFVWTFSGLRQGIVLAMGIYYLLDCLEKDKTLKLILITVLLSLIHSSAIILVPLYMSTKMDLDRGKLIILVFIGVLASIIPLGNIIVKLTWIPIVSRLLPYIGSTTSLLNILDFKSLGRLLFLFIGLFYYNSYSSQDGLSKKIINIHILSLILYFFFKFSELTAARLSIYGMFLNVLILPNIYYMYKDKFDKLIYISCLGVLSTLYFNKELRTMKTQAGLVHPQEVIIPYTNNLSRDKYTFDKRYFFYLRQ